MLIVIVNPLISHFECAQESKRLKLNGMPLWIKKTLCTYVFTNLTRKVLIVWHALSAPDFPQFSLRDERATVHKKIGLEPIHLERRILYCRAMYIPLRLPSISSGLDHDQIDWSFTPKAFGY